MLKGINSSQTLYTQSKKQKNANLELMAKKIKELHDNFETAVVAKPYILSKTPLRTPDYMAEALANVHHAINSLCQREMKNADMIEQQHLLRE